MKSLSGCLGLATALLMGLPLAGARANALTETTMAERPAEHLPPQPLARLEVEPARIELPDRYRYVQVLVTGRTADGQAADVTRLAQFTIAGEVARVQGSGQVAPVKDGEGVLKIAVGNLTAEVPVTVRGQAHTPVPDFIRDVNPVMTKLGCNAGTCHGAKEGKVGFKLSLRGYDPLFDVRALKDDLAGRRLSVASPDDSLMLLKATAGVPHEGGQRTKMGEKYYEILRAWIADGAKLHTDTPRVAHIDVLPKNPVVQEVGSLQQTRIVATYADGQVRDVTAEAFIDSGNTDVAVTDGGGLIRTLRRGEAPLLARYEGNYAATTITVMGDRRGFQWQQPPTWGRIDELVAAKWQRMQILPSEVCRDEEYLRRIWLDLTGLPPSADEVRAFMADSRDSRTKRAEVVDKLIGSPDFLDFWTNKWCDLLEVNSKFLGREGAEAFRGWIRHELEARTPYDQFVRKLIDAQGSTRENPAANYWKVLRTPDELLENTTHLFLATRFNCNKCHDHPFERWTQDQYYHFGAFFAQVGRARDPQSGAREIKGTAVEKSAPLFEIISDTGTGEMVHLRTGKAAAPEFPYTAKPVAGMESKTRRDQLAAWLTSTDNRYFAMSYANRIWGYLTGVGVIEPLDDIRAGNPPSNPELLEYLSKEFVGSGFDVRHLMRLICLSRTYQLSISTNKWNEDDRINYSHATARRLPAEVLYDSVIKVTGSQAHLPGVAVGTRAGQLPDSAIDLPSGFLAVLGRPPRESACECERSSDIRLGSVMSLLSGPAVADAIGDAKSGIAALAVKEKDDRKLVEEVFFRVLNRPPQEVEMTKVLSTWKTITSQDATLQAEWKKVEAEQAPIIEKMEAERVAAIGGAKTELARYEKEIEPKVAAAEKQRLTRVAAAEAAVKEYETKLLAPAVEAWEAALPIAQTWTAWKPLAAEIRSVSGSKAVKAADGSIEDRNPALGPADLSLSLSLPVAGITGFLIEALPDAASPGGGPGSSGGNFVLTEFTCEVTTKAAPTPAVAKFARAEADFSQEKFGVATAIDGNNNAPDNGWAVSPQFGRPHRAAFALAAPLGDSAGATVTLKLFQRRPAFHMVHFRLWYTTDKRVALGLPEDAATALRLAPEARTREQKAAVLAHFRAYDPEGVKRALTLAQNKLPLPTDAGVIERRDALAKAEEPIRLDPHLVQLRQDRVQSQEQAVNERLTGAQDLVWALVNNPAFLFNH